MNVLGWKKKEEKDVVVISEKKTTFWSFKFLGFTIASGEYTSKK
jgi:regulation of enolase protein 1 (concanavalin A-like superfamily)